MSAEDPDAGEDVDEEEDIRYFVRIGQTDLDGTPRVDDEPPEGLLHR